MDDQPAPTFIVFTPENVPSIDQAFAEAVHTLGQTAKQECRARLAEKTMALARGGELDEQRLGRLSALAVLGHIPDHVLGQAARHPANATR